MYKVALINLPFADVRLPSIALTQLKCVLERAYPDAVSVRILNLNHDFSQFLGLDLNGEIVDNGEHLYSGLGDWLFRQVAFPDAPDNSEAYFTRHYPRRDAESRRFRERVLEKRRGISGFFSDAIARYELGDADLVGLTSMFSQNVACLAFARSLKVLHPAVTIVMGGANCEYPMGRELIQNVDVIDYVFSGPGLISLPQLVGSKMAGDHDACDTIDGVFSRRNVTEWPGEGLPEVSSSPSLTVKAVGKELDINASVPLDYSEFLESYKRVFSDSGVAPIIPFETSRGCWWGEKSHCTFCGLNGASMRYRSMAPELALEHIRSLFSYSAESSMLQCVDNILPKAYFKDVLPHLDTPSNLTIFYEVKADLSEADVKTLADARVLRIQPGIEALSSSTLKLMGKGTTAFQNITLLKHCVSYGVKPEWNLLLGFPGETAEVFQKYVRDLPHLVHLCPPSGAFPVRFDRYSPYFMNAASYGLKLQPYQHYAMTYPFEKAVLENLAYFFKDQNYEAEYMVQMLEWLAPIREAIKNWKDRWKSSVDRPRLEFERVDDRLSVLDTRGEHPLRHVLTREGADLLGQLRTQLPLARLQAPAGASADVLEKEISSLRSRNLVFEESDRLLSLVLDPEGLLNADAGASSNRETALV